MDRRVGNFNARFKLDVQLSLQAGVAERVDLSLEGGSQKASEVRRQKASQGGQRHRLHKRRSVAHAGHSDQLTPRHDLHHAPGLRLREDVALHTPTTRVGQGRRWSTGHNAGRGGEPCWTRYRMIVGASSTTVTVVLSASSARNPSSCMRQQCPPCILRSISLTNRSQARHAVAPCGESPGRRYNA